MLNLQAPLNELLKKRKEWAWTAECQKAFEKIMQVFTSNLFLIHYDPEQKIIVASDASIEAWILHKLDDGSIKPIAHASRTLLPTEKITLRLRKNHSELYFQL